MDFAIIQCKLVFSRFIIDFISEIEEMGAFLFKTGDSENDIRQEDVNFFERGLRGDWDSDIDEFGVLVPFVGFFGFDLDYFGHFLKILGIKSFRI